MATKLQLTHVGEDWWGRQVYQDTNGNYYKDINIFSDEPPKVLNASCPRKDFDGEPDYEITDFEIINK